MKRIKFLFLTLIFLIIFPILVRAENINAKISSTFLNVRSGPGSNNSLEATLIYGTDVIITEYNSAKTWAKIVYDNGKVGWVSSKYLMNNQDLVATDDTYCNQLVSSGFDKSYCPYLTRLHQKYPNWIFTPLITNLEWNDVLSGEEGLNYIESDNDAYRASATLKEAPDWYTANQMVNAYFLDPRNFLTEQSVFMFEDLSFNQNYHTLDAVKEVISGTRYSDYGEYIYNAGKAYGVSPIHMAARIVQEGSSTAGKEFSWDNQTYSGYYNFFNIGAYGATPATRGLAYAAGLLGNTSYGVPWNTPEKAINGGASYLANGYITSGQHTLYLEKFNTNPNAKSKLYTHQYMTNIMAPLSESNNIYLSYNDNNLLNSKFNFVIPVYKGMPNTYQPSSLSNNNYLSTITINGNVINGFDEDILNYKYYITNDTTTIDVNAIATKEQSKVEGIGKVSLSKETTEVKIIVTAENGSSRTYTLSVIRVSDTSSVSDIINKIDVRLNNNVISGIKTDTNVNNLINSINKVSPSASVVIKNTSGNVITDGSLVTGYTIIIKTVKGEEETFSIAVTGDPSGDGEVTIVDLLKIQKHLLNSAQLSGSYLTAADVNKDSVVNLVDLLKIQKYLLKDGDL